MARRGCLCSDAGVNVDVEAKKKRLDAESQTPIPKSNHETKIQVTRRRRGDQETTGSTDESRKLEGARVS